MINNILINFLTQTLPDGTNGSAGALGFLIGIFLAFLIVFLIIGLAIYIYTSLVLMKIAHRTQTAHAWFAWIPILSSYLLAKIAKKNAWPLVFLFLGIVFYVILLFLNGKVWLSLIFLILSFIFMIIFVVFSYIWLWKMFEAVGRPGWWVLLSLIPVAGFIVFLILLGVAAWGNPKSS